MTPNEKRALKQWLTSLLPEGLSRNDVAELVEADRKTVSAMLNPESPSFGRGLTMLRYLQLVGAVIDAPTAAPGLARLAALEEKVTHAIETAAEDRAISIRLRREIVEALERLELVIVAQDERSRREAGQTNQGR